MSALPSVPLEGRQLPEYLPARMVNEDVYCPRLFFYEWGEGLFRHSADTVEGAIQHEKADKKSPAMPTPGGVKPGWSCGRRIRCNWRSRDWCCGRTGINPKRAWRTTRRRGRG